jgi:hypothetical protein
MSDDEDLAGPVQSLRENFRGHVLKVQKVSGKNEIEVHVPKGSALDIRALERDGYRGHKITRVESEQTLNTPKGPAPTADELEQFERHLQSFERELDKQFGKWREAMKADLQKQLGKLEGRIGELEKLSAKVTELEKSLDVATRTAAASSRSRG